MSHYFTIPVSTDGLIADPNIARNFQRALNQPFTISDVFIYSHGWWTSASSALILYNQFSIEFSSLAAVLASGAQSKTSLPRAPNPASALGVGVHWPSMISEDDRSLIDHLQAFSFYSMGARANAVGKNAVYSLLRLIVEKSPAPPRIHLLGHSFGCRVVCSAIQEILDDPTTLPGGKTLPINAVLLAPAFDQNDLERGQLYGGLCDMPNLRVLSTFSSLDSALNHDYPLSQKINIFKGSGQDNDALGGLGATPKTLTDFGGATALTIQPGFDHTKCIGLKTRFVSADITPLHQANTSFPKTDHHSDIFLPELYELICGFLFG
jgi:hypothetical protein